MSESDLKRAVLDALAAIGVLAWSNAQGGRTYRTGLGKGSADVIACVKGATLERGRFVGLELKMLGSKRKPHEAEQAAWRKRVNDAGGYAAVVRTVEEAVKHVRRAAEGLDATAY